VDATDTLFGEPVDDTTVRVELRLKWNSGPFDTDGYSLEIIRGGHLVALEVTPIAAASEPRMMADVLAPALTRLYQIVLAEKLSPLKINGRTRRSRGDAVAQLNWVVAPIDPEP
jgi:hypothetical protein